MDLARNMHQAENNQLVAFEISRRLGDVPRNLLELFFMAPDLVSVERWHTLPPWERFEWVGTLLRYRCPGATLAYGKNKFTITHRPG